MQNHYGVVLVAAFVIVTVVICGVPDFRLIRAAVETEKQESEE